MKVHVHINPRVIFITVGTGGLTPSVHHNRHVHHWVTHTGQTLAAREVLGCLKGLGQVNSTLQFLLKAKQILVSLKEVVCCKSYK